MKIFAVNPGSTSTKVALIEDEKTLSSQNVAHQAEKLGEFEEISDQLSYRLETIMQMLEEKGITLEDVDAFVGRGGGLFSCEGGVYRIDELLLGHSERGANGIQHPAQLGPQIADRFAKQYQKPAFVVNPPDVDELQDVARMTGIRGVYRNVHLHALNLKETAIRHAKAMGKDYGECNFVVCHIGGGISVSAHRKGRMVDGYDIAGGEGPMTPTRCGSISVASLTDYAKGKEPKELKKLCTRQGGFVSLLGTSDAIEVTRRAAEGDPMAEMAWKAMIYQTGKCIASMAAVLCGEVDGILLGGGMVHNRELVEELTGSCGWIAPVSAYPGEFEMEAMAAGAIRAMTGLEPIKTYTGKPAWTGFAFEREAGCDV